MRGVHGQDGVVLASNVSRLWGAEAVSRSLVPGLPGVIAAEEWWSRMGQPDNGDGGMDSGLVGLPMKGAIPGL